MSDTPLPQVKKLAAPFRSISEKCYAGMQSETALALTAPYHVEELAALEDYFEQNADAKQPFTHFVAIGCGNLRYMDVALRYCKTYTAIDPNLHRQIDPEKKDYLKRRCHINILDKGLEEVHPSELPAGRKLFLFLFNVFPYISNALAEQQRLASSGDSIIISSWNNKSFEALRLQKTYYDYLNGAYPCSLARAEFNGYIDEVERKSAAFCSSTERIKRKTTDILALKV
jgi:hypothetical protein